MEKTDLLKKTKLLDYDDCLIQSLIYERGWRYLSEYDAIGAVYHFVKDEILFGYNRCDTLTASEVLSDGIGQCNTKSTLLMALLRALGIPCRLHGFTVSKDFQKGATSGIVSFLAPSEIVHTWVEVLFQNRWIVLEGVIIDDGFLQSIKQMYRETKGIFRRYAIAIDDFPNLAVDWTGKDTFIQSKAIVKDFGIFPDPDSFFSKHSQNLGILRTFLYEHIGCKKMTRNINRLRKLAKSCPSASI